MSIFRLSGKVDSINERSGTRTDAATGQVTPWSMKSLSVRVNDFVVTDVSLGDDQAATYNNGQDVDLIVDVEAKGGYVRTRIVGDWPKPGQQRHAAA